MTKRKLKFISFVLSVIITVCAIPISSVGATTVETNVPIDNNTQVPIELEAAIEGKPIETITEIVSRREENVKHFRLPDGSVQAIVYANAVHRKDENGDWQDINNNLSDNNTKIANAYVTDDLRLTFAKSLAAGGHIFTLNENGYSMSMELMPNDSLSTSVMALTPTVGSSTVSVANAPDRSAVTSWSSVEEAKAINNQSSIVYTNIRANTDLEYVLVGNSIKENIIINSPTGNYIYKFKLSLGNLTAALKDNGTITLADDESGETKYHLPAPFMYDANGERSENVHYTLTESAKGTYILSVIADSTWINDSDRAFPVVVDPSVDTYHLYDLYINGSAPNTNYNVAGELMVSSDKIAFFRVIMPDIPAGSTITSATLSVPYYYYSSVTSGSTTVGAYEILQSWNHETVTWNSMAQYSNMGISTTQLSTAVCYGNIGAYIDSVATANFNVTSAYRKWYNGTSVNNGIALKYISGNSSVAILARDAAPNVEGAQYSITYAEQPIQNGVYKLKNVASGLYMDVTDRGTTSGTPMQVWEGTATGDNKAQLFKIAYLGSAQGLNYYSIRAMTNNNLALFIPSSGVATMQTFGSTDHFDTSSLTTYTSIVEHSQGKYIVRRGYASEKKYLTQPSGAVNGAQLSVTSTVTDNSLWVLEPYTGESIDGARRTNGDLVMYAGASYDFDAVMYSSTIGRNGPVTFSVLNTDNTATDLATIDATTGVFTALKPGTVKLRYTYAGSPTTWYALVEIKLANGTYYFNNAESGKYMRPDNGGDNFHEQHEYDGSYFQQWELSHVENGYYTIQNSSNTRYLTAPTDTDDGSKIIFQFDLSTNNDNQLWRIIESDNGRCIIKSKSRENTNLVIAVTANGNGANVIQTNYTNDSDYKDEWIFITHKDVSLVALPETYDRTSFFDSVINNLSDIGYTDCYDNAETISRGATTGEIIGRMANSKITVIRTHGAQQSITTSDGSLTQSSMADMSAFLLEDSQLVIYGACLTGLGRAGASNLVNATHDIGCATVIGFEESVWSSEVNDWCDAFFLALTSGASIYESCQAADIHIRENWYDSENPELNITTDSWYIAGSIFATFSP